MKCHIMWHFYQGLHCLLKNDIHGKLQFCLEIKTCDPLNYTLDHSKFIASIQKEGFIGSFKVIIPTFFICIYHNANSIL